MISLSVSQIQTHPFRRPVSIIYTCTILVGICGLIYKLFILPGNSYSGIKNILDFPSHSFGYKLY